MVSPLYVEIAIHYHTSGEQFERRDAPACREALSNLVKAGMLVISGPPSNPDYHATDGLRVWVEAICAVPFPVQMWLVPGMWREPTDEEALRQNPSGGGKKQ